MTFESESQQCLEKLIWATRELQVDIKPSQLSKIADLIVQTMTGPWRYFHTPEHIFEVGGSENAIEVLAALFHDLVYVQVDKSVNFNLTYYISPFIQQIKEKLYIREEDELPEDFMCDMVMDIFGFNPGKELSPFAGQNEFLSALVCAKVLEPFASRGQILKLAACIEATIPFRFPSKEGVSASEQLYLRLKEANSKYKTQLSAEELSQTVRQAVRMSNRDVGSFANPSSAEFLDGTWSLLPETNHNLQNATSYTVYQYRVALQKMEGFMNFLKPGAIFQQFDGEPNDAAFQDLLTRAGRNLDIARLYLGSKLYTIALLEALSLRVGTDIPLSTMMGESGDRSAEDSFSVEKLENFLPEIAHPYHPQTDVENEVLNLLEKGRSKSSSYDIKNSPLTTFIVKLIGFDEIRTSLAPAKEFFQNNISGEEFLSICHSEVTAIVTKALVKLFDRRKAALCND
jgi:hypothetical protein